MKSILGVVAIMFTISVSASTCIQDESEQDRLNNKYRDEVDIETFEQEGSVDVIIKFPKEIEGQKYNGATLMRGDIESLELDFMIPLEATETEEQLRVWYLMGVDLIDDNFISISYSPTCGPVLEYQIVHNKQLNEDAASGAR